MAGGAAVVAAIGYLAGDATRSEPPASGPRTVAAEDLSVRLPSDWRKASSVPEVPGLSLVRAAAAQPATGGGAVVFGVSDGSGPTLLPAALRDRLDEAPAPDATVRLGDLEAYRYDALQPRGADAPMTVYVSPTTSGVATVACLDGVARPACDAIAASLEARESLRPVEVGPVKDYADAVGPILTRLGSRRSKASRTLAKAKQRSGQAKAAASVADAYGDAAAALAKVHATPLERDTHPAVVTSLKRASAAYGRLAQAARKGNRSSYASARTDARRADAATASAVEALEPLGYTVS